MVSKEFVVKNPTGIHARPASLLVQMCTPLTDEITFITDTGKKVNPKSIISVLTGGMSKGVKITIEVTGDNEVETLDKIYNFLDGLTE